MSDIQVVKFHYKCPECGNDMFKVDVIVMKNFFITGGDLDYTMLTCTKCGWKSHPETPEGIKNLLTKRLRGEG